ncbi:hypothetical protein JCM5296_006305 [Sporobolomyces johnsonii]
MASPSFGGARSPPWHSPPTSATPHEQREAQRAHLVASLLADDTPVEDVHSSAVLQPFRHLLAQQSLSDDPTDLSPTTPSRDGSFELVSRALDETALGEGDEDDPAPLRAAVYSARGSQTAGSDYDAARPSGRRGSFASLMLWSPGRSQGGTEPALDLNPEEEERLANEWGLSDALSNVESQAGSLPTSPVEDMTGVGLFRFPGTSMSEAGLLDLARERSKNEAQREKAEMEAGGEGEEDVEMLETRSMPDLERPTMVSFAASVLDGLDARLAAAGTTKGGRDALNAANEETGSEAGRPRIKIIERTPAQRNARSRSQSVGPALGLRLPSMPDFSAVSSAGTSVSSKATGIAIRDSLFVGPSSTSGLSSGRRNSTFSNEALSGIPSRPASRASLNPAVLSAGFPSTDDEEVLRYPAQSVSGADELPPRPSSAFSMSHTGFTSRFDPAMIALQREEQLKDRPVFTNPEAGQPPRIVLMPAPLAGRPPSPPRRVRVEGPGSEPESDDDEETEEEEEEEDEEEPKPQRPAGALYGRSLMDVMAERKAHMKAQQRAYVPGQDGRRNMMDWKDSPAAQGALAKLEGRAEDDDHDDGEKEEDLPLALLPAGGALKKQKEKERMVKSKTHLSIFGPDLIYQRELAELRKIEEAEREEREERERIEAEKEEKRREKEERKRAKKAKRKSGAAQLAIEAAEQPGEFRGPMDMQADIEREGLAYDPQEPFLSAPSMSHSRTHSLAPSLSLPALADPLATSSSGSNWFEPQPTQRPLDQEDEEDDDEDPAWKPRPIGQFSGLLGSGGGGARRESFKWSGSESESESEADEDVAGSAPPIARREPSFEDHSAYLGAPSSPSHDLPLPGEPSIESHGAAPVEEEDEDEAPLGRRYSRMSLMFSPTTTETPALQVDLAFDGEPLFPPGTEGEERHGEEDEDEDDKPLGHRFSTIHPAPADDDDVPLAIRRISLSPPVIAPYSQRFQPFATITPLEDNNAMEALATKSDGGDSDDLPLGLKQATPLSAPIPPNASGYFSPPMPTPFYAAPPAFQASQFFDPHLAMMGGVPVMPSPHDSAMQLALAQMQMQAAMQAGAMGGGGGVEGGTGGMIERWRQEVA